MFVYITLTFIEILRMKISKINLFLILFTIIFFEGYSQYTEVINSNKPGFSESPYSVGTGVYQFESNLFLRNTNSTANLYIPKSFGIDLLFRTSFLLEKLELNTQITYQRDEVFNTNLTVNNYNTSGLSRFTLAAKYLLYQPEYKDKSKEVRSWKRKLAFDYRRLIPSVAIYAGLNTDFLSNIYKTGNISPKVGILLQQNLSNHFNIITNLFYDNIGTDFNEYSFIITSTYNYNQRWSWFLENQTRFQQNQNTTNFGAGLAYLFNKNLQINTSGRYLLENQTSGFFLSLGVSYRIDRHKDNYTVLDDNGNELKDTPINRYNKKRNSFFNRLFSIFTKKKTKKTTRKRKKRKRKN